MILAISIDNARLTLGLMNGVETAGVVSLSADAGRTSDEYALLISQALSLNGFSGAPEGSIIASVVPQLTDTVRAAVRRVSGKTPFVLGAGLKTGLNIKIENPASLGADMVACAVAALESFTPPLVVVDVGPAATTFSVLDADGCFIGGAIAPGLESSVRALCGSASLLPSIHLRAPRRCIGQNTSECMRSGAVFGWAGMIDGMLERISAELGREPAFVATGALARDAAPHCRHRLLSAPTLLLRGLALIYGKNSK